MAEPFSDWDGPDGPAKPERKVWSVSELARRIKGALEGAIGSVWVEGEISNLRRPASGHAYFTLKDAAGQLRAVMFRGAVAGVAMPLKDGLLVRGFGQVTMYEAGGDVQIVLKRLEAAGEGELMRRLELLKKKLAAEGLFDEERKRPLPALPQHVGVVTSPTGAAIRDILQVLDRRFANLHVVIAPARVQGAGAAEEIAEAIGRLNALGGLDVLIVGRGGGSLEDLWCFNEEVVVRAIVRSAVPVISAVGHEIDWTLSDFAADVRAPTPSAAAEMVVKGKDELERRVADARRRLALGARAAALAFRPRLDRAARPPRRRARCRPWRTVSSRWISWRCVCRTPWPAAAGAPAPGGGRRPDGAGGTAAAGGRAARTEARRRAAADAESPRRAGTRLQPDAPAGRHGAAVRGRSAARHAVENGIGGWYGELHRGPGERRTTWRRKRRKRPGASRRPWNGWRKSRRRWKAAISVSKRWWRPSRRARNWSSSALRS
jgi:exodeoxyribonuclease VII large subunit